MNALPLITCEGGIKRLSLGRLTEQACAARWLIANDKVSGDAQTSGGIRASVCRGCAYGARRAGDEVDPVVVRAIEQGKNPDAVKLGQLGGLKGGPARAASLDADELGAIAKRAAGERWKDHKPTGRPPKSPNAAEQQSDRARRGHDARPCKNKACSTLFVPRFALQIYCKPQCSPSHYVPVRERATVAPAPAPAVVTPAPKRDYARPEAESAPTLDDIRDWLGARRGDAVEQTPPVAEQTQSKVEQGTAEPAPDTERCCARPGCGQPVRMPGPGVRGSKPSYCSTTCRDRANYERDQARANGTLPDVLTCKDCGKQFERNKIGPPRRYCVECNPPFAPKPPPPAERECIREQCRASFKPQTVTQIYCSLACRIADENKRRDEREKERDAREAEQGVPDETPAGFVRMVCAHEPCAKPFITDKPTRKYCSVVCSDRAYKHRLRTSTAGGERPRERTASTLEPTPYTLRCGRFAIECRSLEDLDAVVKRYGGEIAQVDGFITVTARLTALDHARMMVAAASDVIDEKADSVEEFIRSCVMTTVEVVEYERARQKAAGT